MITLNGTTGITTPDITSAGSLNIDASAPDNSLVVNSAGNVGIGTSSPSTYANGFAPVLVVGTATNVATIQGRTDGPVGATNGVSFGGSYQSNPINGARVTFNAEGGAGQQGSVSFWTKSTNDDTNQPTERARIDSSGNLKFNSGYGSVATAYGCRAWVNFNGTGAVAIRASGNVSSITDNGTGDYTVNYTTAMPDGNYCGVARGDRNGNPTSDMNNSQLLHTYLAGSVRLKTGYPEGVNTLDDSLVTTVAIFR